MDWDKAIERNRVALHRILAMLVAMVRSGPRSGTESQRFGFPSERTPEAIAEGWACSTLPRHLHRAVLRLLRPAESATRRLIILVARGLLLPPPRPRRPEPIVLGKTGASAGGKPAGPRSLTLPLFDPLPRQTPRRPTPSAVPRICVPGFTVPFPVAVRRPPMAGDPIDTARLTLRLSALASALDDLPGHARRFARWTAARDAVGAQNKGRDAAAAQHREQQSRSANPRIVGRIWPLRPGQPPGRHRAKGRRQVHEVHHVLGELHELALWALEGPNVPPDTS
ncbi:hypothetical protein [Mesorhizobium sp. CAU 1732]|uniref:hypothetical protein n=1 Tax=Mesorhizobium sp. CAU 1732 TaxID=3140358 RepID=UPI0032606BDB